MMPFEMFQSLADRIPYTYRHPPFLYALIRWLRPGVVVEVGTHIGMSAVWMGRALQENGVGSLYCIDNFCWTDQPTQEQQWNENVSKCGLMRPRVVTLVKGRSQEVEWPAHVDFAYIDGNHTTEVCLHDVEKSVGLGATCIVLNDTATCAGVRKVAEYMRVAPSWEGWGSLEVPFDAGLFIALKRQPLPEPTQGNFDPWDKT